MPLFECRQLWTPFVSAYLNGTDAQLQLAAASLGSALSAMRPTPQIWKTIVARLEKVQLVVEGLLSSKVLSPAWDALLRRLYPDVASFLDVQELQPPQYGNNAPEPALDLAVPPAQNNAVNEQVDNVVVIPREAQEHPIFQAVLEEDLSRIHEHLANGCDVNVRSRSGSTPLLFCFENECSRVDIVTYLVDNGADVNARNEIGETPLMRCVKQHRMNLTGYLVEKGADVNAADNEGNTALMHAFTTKDQKILLRSGADVLAVNRKGENALMVWFKNPILFFEKSVLLDMIAQGIDVNAVDVNGNSVLMRLASHYGCNPTKMVVFNVLIGRGADVNLANNEGETPLMKACFTCAIDCLRRLVALGADKTRTTRSGKTARSFVGDYNVKRNEILEVLKER